MAGLANYPKGQTMKTRLRLAWACLRGRPVGYQLTIQDGGFCLDGATKPLMVGCTVVGAQGAGFTISNSHGAIFRDCHTR